MGMHSQTRRGNWVRVVLTDGTSFTDRFVERPKCKRWLVFERVGKVTKAEIRSFTVMRGGRKGPASF